MTNTCTYIHEDFKEQPGWALQFSVLGRFHHQRYPVHTAVWKPRLWFFAGWGGEMDLHDTTTISAGGGEFIDESDMM